MNFFTLLYPCFTLATRVDPLEIAASLSVDGRPPAYEQVFAVVREQVKELLKEKQVTEDEASRGEADIQKITDDAIKGVDDVVKAKEQELMAV